MPIRSVRVVPTLLLLLTLLLTVAPVAAQEGESEVESAQASPDAGSEAALGWLQVIAVTCEDATGPASVNIYLPPEFAPDASCNDGSAGVWIDGIDYGAATPVLELQLAAATYSLMEPVSGASRNVDVYEDSLTVAYVVTTTVVASEESEPTEADAAAETTTLSMQMHVCDPGIQDADALLAIGGRAARLAECPILTLPDNYAPEGSVTAGQAWFDVAVSGDSGYSAALSAGAFVSDAVCESSLGLQLSTDPYDDACFSTSSYDLAAPQEVLTLTMSALPDLHRFGFAETGDDLTSVWIIDQASGLVGADPTASVDEAVVHIYLFSPPQLTIVQHLCGPEVTTTEAFGALEGFLARTSSCPSVTREAFGFDATIADGWGVSHAVSNVAPQSLWSCEADLGFDTNGVNNDNACLEFASYPVVNVGRGAVEVYPTYPEGFALAGVDFTPGTSDASTLLGVDAAQGQIALDTTYDGNVILHIYGFQIGDQPAEPSATATSTAIATATTTATATATSPGQSTPSPTAIATIPSSTGTGTVQVVALYCLGSQNRTSLKALAPGQDAGQAEIGGQCFGGDAHMQIAFAGEGAGEALQVGRDGVAWFENAPAGSGHSITDLVSGKSASFSVITGSTTRIVLRIDAALGSTSSGTATESGQQGESTGVDPLDLLGMLVTDVLVTDELNFADAGEMSAGSYDANAYSVDLLGGLAVDELAGVTADGMPSVGNGELAPLGSSGGQWLMLLSALAFCIMGLVARGLRRNRGLSRD